MDIQDLDIPTPEEIKQFYSILEKMNKIEKRVQKENSNETNTEPLSLYIRLKLDIDIIENGKSLTQPDNIVQAIKRDFEIPVLNNNNPEDMANDILDNTKLFLEKLLKEKYDV